ncbi:ABC transporter ATP-binding protein [Pseudogracilibacillus sp. SO30301A]|uniref:ABC transporter ATP-binding protein n=1 Tax=Pseudogracilibacillus sp. SO30301A TaxID=3098291 RepID=UPI00300DF50A
MHALELQDITVSSAASSTPIIDNFSLQVEAGECVVLCGESGCGKTTITRVINGLVPEFYDTLALSGDVKHFGNSIKEQTISDVAKNVGSVFQNPKSQFFNLDTSNELIFGCENLNLDREEILKRAEQTIAGLNLKNLVNRNIFELSGGEKQRIACGSIISMRPKILLLDEPTANLDYESIEILKEMLLNLKSLGYTIVLSEHRLYWLEDLADRFIYLQSGKQLGTYTFNELYHKSEQELSEMGLRSMNVAALFENLNWITERKRWELCKLNDKKNTQKSLEITLEDVSVAYQNTPVFQLPKLSFSGGSIIGIVGENGAGKTTFINTLLGFMKHQGTIRENQTVLKKKALNKGGFMVMQDVNQQLFSNTLMNEVLLGTDASKEQAQELLEKLGLASLEERHPASLSGGEKQRVAVASALLSNKRMIVFDEPTSGLDRKSLEQFCAEIKELSSPDNLIFIVTHDIEVIFQLVDFILPCSKYKE